MLKGSSIVLEGIRDYTEFIQQLHMGCYIPRLIWWLTGKGLACQFRRGFSPWVRGSLWERHVNAPSILAWEVPQTEKPVGYGPWVVSWTWLSSKQQQAIPLLFLGLGTELKVAQTKEIEQMIIIKLILKGRVRGHYM